MVLTLNAPQDRVKEDGTVEKDKLSAKAPMLLLMAGFAGVGKTTLAQYMNNTLQWKMLNKDDLKRQRLADGEEVKQAGWNAFEELFKLIEQETIIAGKSVIIDTSNEKPFIFENVMEILEQMNREHIQARLKVILCVANKEARTQRLHKRGSVFAPYVRELPTILDDSELPERFKHLLHEDILQELSTILDNPDLRERFEHLLSKDNVLIVNTNLPLESYADFVLEAIEKDFAGE